MGLDLFLLIYTEHVYISSYMYIDIYVCISHLHRQTQLYICMHLYFYPRLCYTYAAAIHKQPLLWLLISALSLQLLCLDLGKRTDLAEKITLYNWEKKGGGGDLFIYLFVSDTSITSVTGVDFVADSIMQYHKVQVVSCADALS